jgi:hypothetical protein
LAILLSGSTYKKDNGYLGIVIGVFGVFHARTQLNDALIASHGPLDVKTAGWCGPPQG